MEYTTNYHLPQWVETDRIQMKDFNQMCADIESGLEGKADKSAVTEVGEEITVVAKEIETLALNVGSAGKNCRIAKGTYTGKGDYGSSNKNSLTFPFVPYLVIVYYSGDELQLMQGFTRGSGYSNKNITVSWSGKKVSWYSSNSASEQYNTAGTYHYIAFGVDE